MEQQRLNETWKQALRAHAQTPMNGPKGPWSPIGGRSQELLGALWKGSQRQPDLKAQELLDQGKSIKLISDFHFEHGNIIRLCERPFGSQDAMDAAMWELLEREAADPKLGALITLGDWAIKDPIGWARKARQLLGDRLWILVGNHDAKGVKPRAWAQEGALASMAVELRGEWVRNAVEINDPELSAALDWNRWPKTVKIGMAHWPMPAWRLPGAGWISAHGHVHHRKARALGINCSIEAVGYQAAPIESFFDARIADEILRRESHPEAFSESSLSREQAQADPEI